MKRRATFSTSGPRIKVRFFGGADLPADASDPTMMVELGYLLGVPTGVISATSVFHRRSTCRL